jgi:glucose-1-phosphate thymidylyltransferase
MKGIILAGGKGTRLYPLTASTNKHLVSVGNLPMIEYPLNTIRNLGIEQINIVTGGENFLDVARYLETVHKSMNFSYHYQREAGGIAQALALAKPSLEGEKIAVILGDNIFEDNFKEAAKIFENSKLGAMVFLKSVSSDKLYFIDADGTKKAKYAMAEIEGDRIVDIEEKPVSPKSNMVVSGLYLYDSTVFDKIKTLTPSKRGEYEISDVLNLYIKEGKLGYYLLKGFWSDAGTFDGREVCERFVKEDLESRVLESIMHLEKDELPEKKVILGGLLDYLKNKTNFEKK